MRLSDVKAFVATTTVEYAVAPGHVEKCEVGYHPAEVTPALLERVQAAADEGNLDVVGVLLEPVLEWWDVLDDDDHRMPTDAATIKVLPLGFLMEVMTSVQEAVRPPDSKA